MELTFMAQWLNEVFFGMDHAILEFWHSAAELGGFVLTPLFHVITLTGEKGIFPIALGVILLFFRKTRKVGVGILLAVAIGALFTNIILKDIIARPRPYADEAGAFFTWWQQVGSTMESDLSFPSGHTTAAMAAMTAVFLFGNKKVSWLAFLYVILIGASRNYLMVHYPSDILGGLLVGGLAALAAYAIVTKVLAIAQTKNYTWYKKFFSEPTKEEIPTT